MDEGTWARLRPKIEQSYIVEDQSLETVRCQLSLSEGIDIKKFELEQRIKKWGLRKNLTQKEWNDVASILRRRQAKGKKSEVFFNGVRQSEQKVRRSIVRYKTNKHSTSLERITTPPLPIVVRVTTPNLYQISLDGLKKLPILHLVEMMNYKFQTDKFQYVQAHSYGADSRIANGSTSQPPSGSLSANSMLLLFRNMLGVDHSSMLMWNMIRAGMLRNLLPSEILDTRGDPQDPCVMILKAILFLVSNQLFSSLDDSLIALWEVFRKIIGVPLLESILKTQCPTSASFAANLFDCAIEFGDIAILDFSLRQGLNPNMHICRGKTRRSSLLPLNRAIELGHIGIFERLIVAGADVNGKHKWLKSELRDTEENKRFWHCNCKRPLHRALNYQNLSMSMRLLEEGALCTAKDQSSCHMLELSQVVISLRPKFCCSQLITALLAAGADIMHVDTSGMNYINSVVMLAAERKGHTDRGVVTELQDPIVDDKDILEIVKRLYSHGVPLIGATDEDCHTLSGQRSLECVIITGHVALVRYLLTEGVRPSEYAFKCAVMTNNMEVAKIVLEHLQGSFLRRRVSYHQLTYAIRSGNYTQAKHLLSSGADVNIILSDVEALDDTGEYSYRAQIDTRHSLDFVRRYHERESNFTPLSAACFMESLDMVQLLLAHGANVNAGSRTALVRAVESGNSRIVEVLLNVGADVNKRWNYVSPLSPVDQQEATPLIHAVSLNRKDIIRLLLRRGAILWEDADYVLDMAVRHNDPELVAYLLPAIKNIRYREGRKWDDILHTAISNQNHKIISQLLGAGFGTSAMLSMASKQPHLLTAVKTGCITMVRTILNLGADAGNPLALAQAVLYDSVEIFHLLLAHNTLRYGAHNKFFGCLALQMAILTDNVKIFEYLLMHTMESSMIFGYEDIRELSFRCVEGSNLNRVAAGVKDITPSRVLGFSAYNALGLAIRWHGMHSPAFVSTLLEGYIDANALVYVEDNSYATALVTAIVWKREDLVPMLIGAGADVNAAATCNMRRTALQLAIETGQQRIIEQLLTAGANCRDKAGPYAGVTALQAAAIRGNINLARELIKRGADVNNPGSPEEGRTALEGAAEYGRIDMVQLLLNAGAQIHGMGNDQYFRAIGFATRNGYQAVWKLLEAYHAATKVVTINHAVTSNLDGLVNTGQETGRTVLGTIEMENFVSDNPVDDPVPWLTNDMSYSTEEYDLTNSDSTPFNFEVGTFHAITNENF